MMKKKEEIAKKEIFKMQQNIVTIEHWEIDQIIWEWGMESDDNGNYI